MLRNSLVGWFTFLCRTLRHKDTVMEKLKENPRIFEYKDAPIQELVVCDICVVCLLF